jgi:single-stranded DNA-binding protein
MSDYQNKIVMVGTLISKRLNTKTKEPVLNMFVRTGNSRDQKVCISVSLWGKKAHVVNKALRQAVDGLKDNDVIDEEEAPLLKIKGELKYEIWETSNGETRRQHSVTASSVQILDDDDGEEDDE